MVFYVVNFVERTFSNWMHYLFFPDPLDDARVWVVWVELEVEEYTSVSLDELTVL